MSPTSPMKMIEIDDEVFEALQKFAEPFVDDPNSVLRRVLNLQSSNAKPCIEETPGRAAEREVSLDSSPQTAAPRLDVATRLRSSGPSDGSKPKSSSDLKNQRRTATTQARPDAFRRVFKIFNDKVDDLSSHMESLDGEAVEWIDDLPSLLSNRKHIQALKWCDILVVGVQMSKISIWNDAVRTDVGGYWPWTPGAATAFGQGRARRGSLLPRSAYEMPILESLIELGGSAAASRVVDLVGTKLEAQLNEVDYEETPGTRVVRWRNRAQFARHDLVKNGQLRQDSPHGVWEISEAGRGRARRAATT